MTVDTVRGGHDTWASSVNNDQNYGEDDKLSLNGAQRQAFVWLKRPFTHEAVIAQATLWFYLKGGGWAGAHVITGKRIIGTWDEGELDWDHRPGIDATHAGTVNVNNGVDGQLVGLDITAIMQDVANGSPNFGIRLEVDTAGVSSLYSMKAASSLQLWLEVDWSVPPDVPRNLSPSGGRAVATSKPLLQWEYRDESGETSQTWSQVQIAADVAGAPGPWTTYDSTKVANTISEWDLALTAFGGLAAGLYWWRAQTWDDNNNPSGFSDPVQFAYTAKSVLTITNPPASPNNYVEETTPPFAFTFTGVLKAARARVYVDDMIGPTFARTSTALKLDGSTVGAGIPRFEGGRFGQSLTVGNDAANPETLTLPIDYLDDAAGTIDVWGYIASLANPPADRHLYELDGGSRLGLRWTSTGHYIAKANGATAIDYTPGAALAIGWHLFTLRWSGTAIALFVDGAQVGAAVLGAAVSLGAATVLYVGSSGAPGNQWNSQLDELRISARSHDDDEISDLFASGRAPQVDDDTVAYLSFDSDFGVDGQAGPFGELVWHQPRSPGLTSPVRPPAGLLKAGGRQYKLEIAAWDNVARADGPVIATRKFTLRRSSVPAAVDTLTVVDNGDGSITSDVFRALTPDKFAMKVDGVLVADSLPIDASLVAPGHWRFTYWRLAFRPNVRHLIEFLAVVSDAGVMKLSKHNPVKTIRPTFAGIALVAPDQVIGPVLVFDRDQPDFVLGEDSTAFRLLNRRDMVTVTNSVGGLEGSVTGCLIDTTVATAKQYSDRLNRMKALSRREELRLIYPGWMNIRVRLAPGLKNNAASTNQGQFFVEIPFHQVADFAVQAPG